MTMIVVICALIGIRHLRARRAILAAAAMRKTWGWRRRWRYFNSANSYSATCVLSNSKTSPERCCLLLPVVIHISDTNYSMGLYIGIAVLCFLGQFRWDRHSPLWL